MYTDPAVKHTTGAGQSAIHFVIPTVPPLSRPIRLHHDGRPFSPPPSSVILSGSLPETAVRAWSELEAQYAPELSRSTAEATVTSARADATRREVDEVEEVILEIKDALAEVRDFEGEDSSWDEEILLGIDTDEADSCDEMPTGRYSRLDGERNIEPQPVLATANRVKESVRRESSASKASSSQEQAAKKDGDVGADSDRICFYEGNSPRRGCPSAHTITAEGCSDVCTTDRGGPQGGGPLFSVRKGKIL